MFPRQLQIKSTRLKKVKKKKKIKSNIISSLSISLSFLEISKFSTDRFIIQKPTKISIYIVSIFSLSLSLTDPFTKLIFIIITITLLLLFFYWKQIFSFSNIINITYILSLSHHTFVCNLNFITCNCYSYSSIPYNYLQ